MKAISVRIIVLALVIGLALGGLPGRVLDPVLASHNRPMPLPAGSISASSGEMGPSTSSKPGLRLLHSDERGVVLELYTPDFDIEPLTAGGFACQLLSVPGYATTSEAGWPQLPVWGAMLGVPPQAEPGLTVLETESVVIAGPHDLCPVPSPIVELDISGEPRYGGMELRPNEQAYATNAFYPATVAEIVSTGFIRSQRVAQLRFHPFQYNPVSGELLHHRRIRVRLDFNAEAVRSRPAEIIPEEGWFEEILRHTLLNYELARGWRIRPETRARGFTSAESQPGYKILVNEDGLYQVTYADLQAAGVEVESVDPRTFRLHNRGSEVPIYVTGEEDGSFDPSDYILFYGQKANTRYTDTNVYWLTYGAGEGKRMAEKDGTPGGTAPVPDFFATTFHWEEDLYYHSSIPSGEEGDHWFGGFVFAYGSPASESYTITLHNLFTTPYSVTIRGWLYGFSHFGPSPDHHTRVYLNGHLIDDATWDGWRDYQFEQAIPSSYLLEATNVISLECPFDLSSDVLYDFVFVDWFEIDYRDTYVAEGDLLYFDGDEPGTWEFRITGFTTDTLEVYDITTPTAPVRILNAVVESASETFTLRFQDTITAEHRYIALAPEQRKSPLSIEKDVPSALRSTANGADYLIIAPAEFHAALLPLTARRAAQGFRTMVVDVQDVYDEFGYGLFDPAAIRDFLAYAYHNWTPPPPSYVLLVGDGNYDFKDNFGYGEPNYIPPYLAYVDPWMGETAADNRYVCVSGDDILPDMHLGRLPVKTVAETEAMVAKILAYEQSPSPGDWNRKVLFVADDADQAGDFAALSDALASHFLPSPYLSQTVYYKVTHPTPEEARAAIIGAINEGRLLVNYIGHASPNFWAWEHLFDLDALDSLTNSQALPLMVPMTCLEGYYILPSPPEKDRSSVGESIVRIQGRGAIASWSPTGLGVAMGHDFLNKGLFEALFSEDVTQLGPATTMAKLYLYNNTGGHRELLDTYILFGDPALRLDVLKADVGIAKGVDSLSVAEGLITYTITYSNAGPAIAHHVVISDLLPTQLLSPTVASSGAAITLRPESRFIWDVADLDAGAGGTITITAVISPTFRGLISNTAVIATSATESDMANNVAGPVVTWVWHELYLPLLFRKD